MPLLARSRALALAACLALAAAAQGCAPESESDATQYPASRGDAVADVSRTPVKRQTVGNCWLYGTNAWIESLHAKATGEQLDLSESYLSYWHWFGQIATSPAPAKVKESGWLETGAALVAQYGLVREADFQPDGGLGWAGVSPTRGALSRVNEALALSTSPLRRAMSAGDRVALRRAYDELWKMPAEIRADLDAVFGPDASRTFATPGFRLPASTRVVAPTALSVRSPDPATGALVTMTVSDVLPGGRAAWAPLVVSVDTTKDRAERRDFERRIQRTLHAGLSVPVVWMVDMNARGDDGAFTLARLREKGPGPAKGSGAHLSVIVDYEVSDVPGFGTLPAGVVETRPAALAAALDERARVRFFRIKNSWGTFSSNLLELVYRGATDAPSGENDLEADYVFRPDANGQTVYFAVTLPPGGA
jgi:hypothetical protein